MRSEGIFKIKLLLSCFHYYFLRLTCNPVNNLTKLDNTTTAQVSAARHSVSLTPAGVRAAPHRPTPRGSDAIDSYISYNMGGSVSMLTSTSTS